LEYVEEKKEGKKTGLSKSMEGSKLILNERRRRC